MNVQFHFKSLRTPDVDSIIDQQVQKLERRLQVFKPDMVSLHGSIADHPQKGYVVSLNLRLPSGQMAAREAADSAQSAVKAAFEDLLEQLVKHKDHLRAQHKWPRPRRAGRTRPVPQVPFEETVAAIRPEPVTSGDVRDWVNGNIGRLVRFVQREMQVRIANGERHLGDVSPQEVVDEAVMYALDDRKERPEKMALEAWLYRMARHALGRISSQQSPARGAVPIEAEGGVSTRDREDSDLAQTDIDPINMINENVLQDKRVATPEEIFANDEIVDMVMDSLRTSSDDDREAFVLFTFEGFTMDEIASITDRSAEDVRGSIDRARDSVRAGIRVSDPIKEAIINNSKIA